MRTFAAKPIDCFTVQIHIGIHVYSKKLWIISHQSSHRLHIRIFIGCLRPCKVSSYVCFSFEMRRNSLGCSTQLLVLKLLRFCHVEPLADEGRSVHQTDFGEAKVCEFDVAHSRDQQAAQYTSYYLRQIFYSNTVRYYWSGILYRLCLHAQIAIFL